MTTVILQLPISARRVTTRVAMLLLHWAAPPERVPLAGTSEFPRVHQASGRSVGPAGDRGIAWRCSAGRILASGLGERAGTASARRCTAHGRSPRAWTERKKPTRTRGRARRPHGHRRASRAWIAGPFGKCALPGTIVRAPGSEDRIGKFAEACHADSLALGPLSRASLSTDRPETLNVERQRSLQRWR